MVIQQYQDPNINRWLKAGYWFSANKYKLYKILIGVLIGVSVIFWFYVIFTVVKIAFIEPDQSYLYTDLVQNKSPVLEIHQKQAPEPIIIKTTDSASSSSEISSSSLTVKSADFVSIITNPNKNWLVEVDYKFVWIDGETDIQRGLILPMHEQALASFGVSVSGLPNSVTLEIVNYDWQRIKDPKKLERIEEMLNVITKSESNIINNGKSAVLKYSISNTSIYTIVDPVFIVTVSRFTGDIAAVGINKAVEIASNESIDLEKRWLHSVSTNLEVKVYPVINYLDDSVYRIPSRDVKIRF
jgi:hypothetical protein